MLSNQSKDHFSSYLFVAGTHGPLIAKGFLGPDPYFGAKVAFLHLGCHACNRQLEASRDRDFLQFEACQEVVPLGVHDKQELVVGSDHESFHVATDFVQLPVVLPPVGELARSASDFNVRINGTDHCFTAASPATEMAQFATFQAG